MTVRERLLLNLGGSHAFDSGPGSVAHPRSTAATIAGPANFALVDSKVRRSPFESTAFHLGSRAGKVRLGGIMGRCRQSHRRSGQGRIEAPHQGQPETTAYPAINAVEDQRSEFAE